MCSSSPHQPNRRPIPEQEKPAQETMDEASDETARRQMMRRGIMSTFSQDRGYSAAQNGKKENLG